MPQRQDVDTVIFYPTAARALLIPQKVSGPPGNLDGRYLSRSGKMDHWIKSQGFVFSSQRDGLSNYNNGADLNAKAVCGFFSPGFEICTLGTQGVGL